MTKGIRSIKSLRSFGIYENHDNTGCDEFSKFNLIYGWNGSGKSTLSKLFRCIELKSLDSIGFYEPSFTVDYNIEGDAVHSVNQANIASNALNIATFNQDFIKDNIDWDKSVKSILLIDQQKIEERKLLEQKKLENKTKQDQLDTFNSSHKNIEEEINKFLTKTAKKVKASLRVIGTEDRKYLNYNRTSLTSLITEKPEAVSSNDSLLSDEQAIESTKAATPVEKPTIDFINQTISSTYFNDDYDGLSKVLKKTVVNEVIDYLKDNPSVQSWVSDGLTLHETLTSDTCNFCGNPITEQRITKLNNHFSDEFKKFKAELIKAQDYCIKVPEITLLASELFFPELQGEYQAAIEPAENIISEINELTRQWQNSLDKKEEDPFNTELTIDPIPASLVESYNTIVEGIQSCVKKHNDKSSNFKAVTTQHKNKLELHYAAEEIIDFDYNGKVTQKDTAKSQAENVAAEIKKLNKEIDEVEQELSNETIAADKFNEELRKFLGRTELSLKFDTDKKGYKISRHGSDSHAENLSEGEKTAIAFVYFATKLAENGNDIKTTIVVVDDPVSSFDSNHLFHSYSFLKKHCEQSMQLFVLTHNFQYFKLVRDWIMKKNKREKVKSKVYTIECSFDGIRKSKIVTAGETLIKYGSEYHYLFSKLHNFKEQESLNLDETYLCANLARKLLESFLSFKFPKKRGDFRQLVADGVKGFPVITEEETEKIYRFINKYSHNQYIELEDGADNMLGESPVIISSILNLVKVIDETHYDEMESLVTS